MKRIQLFADELFSISESLDILARLTWPKTAKSRFFEHNCIRLPEITYPPFDPVPLLNRLYICRESVNGGELDDWLNRHIDYLENSLLLLANRGKPRFFEYSKRLYGIPTTRSQNKVSCFELATTLITNTSKLTRRSGARAHYIPMSQVVELMKGAVDKFGSIAPKIELVDELAANALASAGYVKLRREALFTAREVEQLIEHEINVHVATLLNGQQTANCKLLAVNHPGTTLTQEGLAVFAEFITGKIDTARLCRLAHRVIAIQMAIEGADFIEVYRYFLDYTDNPEQSFQNARRVFRGGVLTGGAPFTKDIVYLQGLLKVHQFFDAAIQADNLSDLMYLFAGRLDVDDLPAVLRLRDLGLCVPPQFLPPWMVDKEYLISLLSYFSVTAMFKSDVPGASSLSAE